ncbi:MAG: DUF1858 domain-containing protein [Planctomycetes bacterium]|nr:DUF1858 domain-containing protein [Planctomycetota bacterium]
MVSPLWPDEATLIPDVLSVRPQSRTVLDRYGLRGCGGPLGPAESLGFFARAHDVPLDQLLRELRAAGESEPQPVTTEPSAIGLADTIYRPFFKAGIAVVLTLGAVWGAYLLVRIAWSGSFTSVGLHEINAHGHAQIFGWIGLFVMGFAYQAFPRFKHSSLAWPRLAWSTFWMMLVGLVAHSLCQPLASTQPAAWWTAVAASVLELAAIVAFAGIILATWRRSGKPLAFYDYYILSSLAWFVIQALYEGVYLTATLAASGDDLLALVATWQAPLRDVQIHGFALLMVLGVSQRIFHHFYALPAPNPRLSLVLLGVINAAVLGEVTGLVLMRTASHAWAGLWYAAVLVLTAATGLLVGSWRIFSPPQDADRSLKFLRTAYVWLFISLGMLVLLPAYQYGLLSRLAAESAAARLGFSHAYYGAARHAITVGFLSLMIVGVSAKVVPTLNGIRIQTLTSLWLPYLLINTGCTLRVAGQTLTDFWQGAFAVAGVSGLLEVLGLSIWGWHLWRIMSGRLAQRHVPADACPDGVIRGDANVCAVLDRYPTLLDDFLASGFTMLANPYMRQTVSRVVSIEQACRRMGVDVQQFLAVLNERREELLDHDCRLPMVPLTGLEKSASVQAANENQPDRDDSCRAGLQDARSERCLQSH